MLKFQLLRVKFTTFLEIEFTAQNSVIATGFNFFLNFFKFFILCNYFKKRNW